MHSCVVPWWAEGAGGRAKRPSILCPSFGARWGHRDRATVSCFRVYSCFFCAIINVTVRTFEPSTRVDRVWVVARIGRTPGLRMEQPLY